MYAASAIRSGTELEDGLGVIALLERKWKTASRRASAEIGVGLAVPPLSPLGALQNKSIDTSEDF